MDVPAVEMRRITKRFPGVLANDEVNFSAWWGEIHALVGENGAGKTTLMNILYGLTAADSGEIFLSGRSVCIRSPRDSIAFGIGMVHQHFMLAPALTWLENIVLGMEPIRFGCIDFARVERDINTLTSRLRLDLDLCTPVRNLSVSAQQKTEIVKVLYRKARILILDEPTSVLTPQEARSLFGTLQQLTSEGMCIIVITHKLQDVIQYAQRVTVLREGRSVASVSVKGTTSAELTKLIVGTDRVSEFPRKATKVGSPALTVKDVTVPVDFGARHVSSISFELHAGEILGIAGVDGSGQREFAEALVGFRRAYGILRMGDFDLLRMSVRQRLRAGLAFIPEDTHFALVPEFTISENVFLLSSFVCSFGLVSFTTARDRAVTLIREFDIRATGPEMPAGLLSGGNKQKLMLAAAFGRAPRVLIACAPTRGLDVGATHNIHTKLLEARADGTAVLLVSYDLDEILSLSDRILVMFQGTAVCILPRQQADTETIGALMLGGVK